jgi:PEP-CTERM motif
MSKCKVVVLAMAVSILCAVQAKADSTPIVLTFEGVGDDVLIGNYYNGGPGGALGVSFGADSLALVSSLAGGSGNFSNAPSGITIAFFLSGAGDVMNVAGGFNTGFSFFYSATTLPGTVTVWSGLNGTGTLLATLTLPPNGSCTPGPNFCHWTAEGVTFSGTAASVNFSGTANEIGFDNITIGSATPGGGPTPAPEPATMFLLGLGSLSFLSARRQKRA